MVKNVIVVSDYGYIEGGAGRIAHETAILLSKNGYNVVFFCAVAPVSEQLKNSSVEVVCLEQADILHEKSRIKGVLRGFKNKEAQKRFKALLERFDKNETVIHVHTWTKGVSSIIFKQARLYGFQVLVTVHDYFLVCPNGGLFNYKTRKICQLNPMSAKCVACNCDSRSYLHKLFRVMRQRIQNRNIRKNPNVSYVFISEFSKREFLKRYDKIPQEKQYFLPNMVNFPKDRRRIECEKNGVYLFIGGITEVKGIRIFCEAVTKAKVKAVVIGQGILKEELEKQYPNIEFVGWKSKDELSPYLMQTRCLIFPSIWYETMGLTPLEVISFGVPVVCSELNAAVEFTPFELRYDGTASGLEEAIAKTADDSLIKSVSTELFENFDDGFYGEDRYLTALTNIFSEILSAI